MASKNSRTYTTVTELGDFGPWVGKLVLSLPHEVRSSEVSPAAFNVFCERHERSDGSVVMRREKGEAEALPSVGYVDVVDAYPSRDGRRVGVSDEVTLVLPECRLTKTIEGTVTGGRMLDLGFRVTQLTTLGVGTKAMSGLVFDACEGDACPALDGWQRARMSAAVDGITLEYGYYTPSLDEVPAAGPLSPARPRIDKAPLVLWLHGAGEGVCGHPGEVERAWIGNRVTALSGSRIQGYFGGAAWIVVPQCPTFWMDSQGDGKIHEDNQSVYTRAIKALLDEFVEAHRDQVDTSRIVVGGLSNGGLMTCRLCADYPGTFSAAIATCAPFYSALAADDEVAALARTPLWFVHSKGDELVDPKATSLPLYARLREAGAEVHMTYFDHVEDLTGRYREADGSPKRTFNHGVWIHVFNDFCRTDLDGTNVIVDGEPMGAWEWAATMRLA